jgi:hypothetical protein
MGGKPWHGKVIEFVRNDGEIGVYSPPGDTPCSNATKSFKTCMLG